MEYQVEKIHEEFDENGKITSRTSVIETFDLTGRGYDNATKNGGIETGHHESSIRKIFEAYWDYRKSQQW